MNAASTEGSTHSSVAATAEGFSEFDASWVAISAEGTCHQSYYPGQKKKKKQNHAVDAKNQNLVISRNHGA